MLSFPILSPVVPAFKTCVYFGRGGIISFSRLSFLICFHRFLSFHPFFFVKHESRSFDFSNRLVRTKNKKKKRGVGLGPNPFQIGSVCVWYRLPPLRGRKHHLLPWHKVIYKVSYILENQKQKHNKAKNTNIV